MDADLAALKIHMTCEKRLEARQWEARVRGIEQTRVQHKLDRVIAATTGRAVVREPVEVVRFDDRIVDGVTLPER